MAVTLRNKGYRRETKAIGVFEIRVGAIKFRGRIFLYLAQLHMYACWEQVRTLVYCTVASMVLRRDDRQSRR